MTESLSTYIKRHIPGCTALELARQAEIPKSTLYRWWQESPARVELLVLGLASKNLKDQLSADWRGRR